MRTILDIGKQGADTLDIEAPTPSRLAIEGIEIFEPIISPIETESINVDTDRGIKEPVDMHRLRLSDPVIFGIVHAMALYAPIVYAQKGQERAVMGMLSLNYDETGTYRRPSISVLPLVTPYPLIKKGRELLPAPEMATMLAGSAHAEGPGVGSHNRPPIQDYEDTFTLLGAISLGKDTILDENGNHTHFKVRKRTTVANSLTDGTLGNVFEPNGDSLAGFSGYGMPMIFRWGNTQPTDAIYIPAKFLPKEQAYGVYYDQAADIALGAGLQVMYGRQGRQAFTDQLKRIADTA
jgi:hypothetical protein